MPRAFLTLTLMAASLPAMADTLDLQLPGPIERQTLAYTCSDGVERQAEYVNSGANSLAILTMDGAPLIFANVIAGSGARYVAGPYEWWTKGNDATFTNQMADAGAEPVSCKGKGM